MFNLETMQYTFFNERDVEIPLLFDLIDEKKTEIKTLLDVGAHWSWTMYAPKVREMLPKEECTYDAIDILEDEKTKAIVDNYYVGNVKTIPPIPTYDLITCISTIEHCGLSTYKEEDYVSEQKGVFVQLLALTAKHLFLTFPYGKAGSIAGQYANITPELLDFMGTSCLVRGMKIQAVFFYNPFPQGKEKWSVISPEEAAQVPIDESKGVQCVCIFYAYKE